MRRPAAFAILLVLLAGMPTGSASHAYDEPLPIQWDQDAAHHGAVWLSLADMQDDMEFWVWLPSQSEYAVGLVLLDPDAGWKYEMRGEPYAFTGERVDVRVNGARTVDLGPRSTGLSTSVQGYAPCDGWISIGGGYGPGMRGHSFGFSYDAGCDLSPTAQLLVWVAAKQDTSWTYTIAAPEPVGVEVLETTSRAVNRAASDFPTGTRASATLFADATVGDAAQLVFDASVGFRGSFAGWQGDGVGTRATASTSASERACPCAIRDGEAGQWTFRLEGSGVALGEEMRVVGVDTSFPW